MAISITCKSNSEISPDELMEWVIDNVDPADNESMISAAERLCALKNNRNFVIDGIRREMLSIADGQEPRYASNQGTIHCQNMGPKGRFIVRTVIWTPPLTKNLRSRVMQDKILSYASAHDHNFSLLTIGYHGSGYKTDIYEYDPSSISGAIGETVEIKFLEHTSLPEDKILYFRPNRDIHVQLYPDEVSISLNLMGDPNGNATRAQYEFDVQNGKILNLLDGNAVRVSLAPFALIECLGADENLIDLLSFVAKEHQSPHIRSRAYSTLSRVCKKEKYQLAVPGLLDSSRLVSETARSILEQ
jgi:hypothetical protein